MLHFLNAQDSMLVAWYMCLSPCDSSVSVHWYSTIHYTQEPKLPTRWTSTGVELPQGKRFLAQAQKPTFGFPVWLQFPQTVAKTSLCRYAALMFEIRSENWSFFAHIRHDADYNPSAQEKPTITLWPVVPTNSGSQIANLLWLSDWLLFFKSNVAFILARLMQACG